MTRFTKGALKELREYSICPWRAGRNHPYPKSNFVFFLLFASLFASEVSSIFVNLIAASDR